MGGVPAVNPEERLAFIVEALGRVGITCLVMGGHAVRFYGVSRNTRDFDLHLSPECWSDLRDRLERSPLAGGQPLIEGPSWRAGAFRRFQIGWLPDGQEEWLAISRAHHLPGPFARKHTPPAKEPYGARGVALL